MSNVEMKARVLALLGLARRQEQRLVEGLSEDERNERGAPDAWAPKDYLVNIMLWRRLQTEKLATAARGERPPVWVDMELVHQINSQAFLEYQERSFREIEAEAQRVYEELIAQVERMSEEELSDPQHYEWQEGEALWGETLGNGLWHTCGQVAALYLKRGERDAAMRVQEEVIEAVREAKLPDETLGVALYNRACFFAVNGWPEKALALLPEALRLRPTLIEWSRHDSDLDGLRANPDFVAIFDDAALNAQAPVSDLVSAQELHDSAASPLVIDVRGASEYAAGHVRGAINIPMGLLAKRLKQVPQGRPIVTYCNMHHRGESRGERAAALLREHGYQARTLDGGYPGWKEHGFPVEKVS